MPSRLLSGNFVNEFKDKIGGTRKLRVASAWMTNSGALEALIERGEKRCEVQAIIGTHGCATTPESLFALADEFGDGSVRLADTDGLFHPKLVLFHRWNGTIAWIGSANFTSGGMDGNTELVLETDDTDALQEMAQWFGRQWKTLKHQDFRAELAAYEPKWAEAQTKRRDALQEMVHGGRRKGVDPSRNVALPRPSTPAMGTIRYRPEARFKNAPLKGVVTYGRGDSQRYASAADGVRQLLRRLSQGREEDFFEECAKRPAFRRGTKRYVAKGRNASEARRRLVGRTNISISRLVDAGPSSWWLSEDSTNERKWNMAKAAIAVANEMAGKPLLKLANQSLESWPDKIIPRR